MAWESIVSNFNNTDAKTDYKNSEKIEQYRISDEAVYMQGKKYLPLSAVTSARTQKSSLNTTGCCGLSIPVFLVVLEYGGNRPARLTFEKEANALKALERINRALDQN